MAVNAVLQRALSFLFMDNVLSCVAQGNCAFYPTVSCRATASVVRSLQEKKRLFLMMTSSSSRGSGV